MKMKTSAKSRALSQEIFFSFLTYCTFQQWQLNNRAIRQTFFDGTNSPKIKVHTGASNDNEKNIKYVIFELSSFQY